jgi:hypothetical protein
MRPLPHFRLVPVLLLVLFAGELGAAEAAPPERTGATLPEGRNVAVEVDMGGMYTGNPRGFAGDKAGILGGDALWNFRLVSGLGVFGKHLARSVILDNVTLLLVGHEVGLRLLLQGHLSLEAAYLTHRFEYQWVDGHPFGAGGLFDHGVELGAWGHLRPLDRLELAAHLLGRYFGEPNLKNGHHFADGHWVMGLGFRMIVEIAEGFRVSTELETLRVYRMYPSKGVEEVTWNTSGAIYLIAALTSWLGLRVGADVSTDMYAGRMPVFETKRSMINAPMATGWLGAFFVL